MKLYLNESHGIEKKEIVGIFDMDGATVVGDTRKFLSRAEREGRATVTAEDIPVSFVVTAKEGSDIRVFFTRNAPKALRRRAERRGI